MGELYHGAITQLDEPSPARENALKLARGERGLDR
jgi:hypothetical protein